MGAVGTTTTIGGLVSPAVATVGSTARLREAADTMAADGLGLVVVADANGPLGVLSERVRDHCAEEIVSVDEDATVADAARMMADAQIRHLAVTRGGTVVGIVSVRDVLRVLVG